MRYVKVSIVHQPDAGHHTRSHVTYPDVLGQADLVTAREFAFRALAEGDLRRGRITVTFPESASYSFRFERRGLVGYELSLTRDQPRVPQLV